MPEPNTVETNNEPTLDQFNQTQAANAATQPAPAAGNEPTKAADAQPNVQQPTGQPAQPQQPAADPYAGFLDGLQVPNGLEIKAEDYKGLTDLATKYNLSKEAVKELVQLDLNNIAGDKAEEDKLVAEAQAKWAQENQAKYGDNLKNVETNCSRVLAELDKEGKFKELLATAGVSGHPATLGFLKTIGDLYLEKSSVNPNATVSTDEEVELENFN